MLWLSSVYDQGKAAIAGFSWDDSDVYELDMMICVVTGIAQLQETVSEMTIDDKVFIIIIIIIIIIIVI